MEAIGFLNNVVNSTLVVNFIPKLNWFFFFFFFQ